MTEREKLLAEISVEARYECFKMLGSESVRSTTLANRIHDAIAALPFFAPESAPAAGESGEEKPPTVCAKVINLLSGSKNPVEGMPRLRAKYGHDTWDWYVPFGTRRWLSLTNGCRRSPSRMEVDRTLSDPAALAHYDAETAPAPED
jgi:hypothetical protein